MYRTEMTIPVKRDSRTFEESRSELFDNLERRCASQREQRPESGLDTRSDLTSPSSFSNANNSNDNASQYSTSTTNSSTNRSTSNRRIVGLDDDAKTLKGDDFFTSGGWDSSVDEWIKDSRRKWDSDMKRLRENFFNLESSNDFFGAHSNDMWPSALTSNLGGMRIADTARTSSTQQQQQQQQHSSSTVSSKTISNGNTVSETNESSHFSSSAHDDPSAMFGRRNLFAAGSDLDDPFARFPSSHGDMMMQGWPTAQDRMLAIPPSPNNAFDMSKDLYELGEDGKLHFKVRFEAKDYTPDDIQVTTIGNRLMVKAKTIKKSGNSSSVKEFSRSVDLPDRIDHDNFSCNLTKDGVLEIDAPVRAPDYEAICFSGGELGIKPRMIGANESSPGGVVHTGGSGSVLHSQQSSRQLSIINKPGPTVISDGYGKKRIHIELQVEPGYLPDDIHVRAEGNRIYIKGRHEEVCGGRSSVREFSKSYDVPESVDPLSVDALLTNRTLIVEAPLQFS